jgi:hypothetical protein
MCKSNNYKHFQRWDGSTVHCDSCYSENVKLRNRIYRLFHIKKYRYTEFYKCRKCKKKFEKTYMVDAYKNKKYLWKMAVTLTAEKWLKVIIKLTRSKSDWNEWILHDGERFLPQIDIKNMPEKCFVILKLNGLITKESHKNNSTSSIYQVTLTNDGLKYFIEKKKWTFKKLTNLWIPLFALIVSVCAFIVVLFVNVI